MARRRIKPSVYLPRTVPLFLSFCLLSGCEDEPIRAYESPNAPAFEAFTLPPAVDQTNPGPAVAQWTAPESWIKDAQPSPMALASFTVTQGDAKALVTITPLAGDAGGTLANVNRWRGQVGLDAIQSIEQQPMTPIENEHVLAGLIDLSAPDGVDARFERMFIGMIPRLEDDSTWFIKMTGPKDLMQTQRDQFLNFIESFRFGAEDGVTP